MFVSTLELQRKHVRRLKPGEGGTHTHKHKHRSPEGRAPEGATIDKRRWNEGRTREGRQQTSDDDRFRNHLWRCRFCVTRVPFFFHPSIFCLVDGRGWLIDYKSRLQLLTLFFPVWCERFSTLWRGVIAPPPPAGWCWWLGGGRFSFWEITRYPFFNFV